MQTSAFFCILQNIAHISINNIYLQKMLHKLQKETTFNKIKEIYVCILDELMNNLHLFIPQFFELGETLTGLIHALVQTRREEILHVHYMTTPKHKNPCPGNHEIYNFGRLFFGHHYNTFTLSGLCPSGEKKTLKRNNSFHYMNCLATTQHKNPCFWGHAIYNFGRSFLGHHIYILTFSVLCLGVKKILKEIMYFHYINYMVTPQHKNPYSRCHEIYNFVRPFLNHYNYALSLSK